MTVKKTLLAIVQEILEAMESEDVNSISDTEEATMIAGVVQGVFEDIVANRNIPEHKELIKLTALSDSDFPTHFTYPTSVRNIISLDYDVSDDSSFEYREVRWCEPEDFLSLVDKVQEDYDNVSDKNAGTNLRIRNDRMPAYYTSFDDNYIVMDSYDNTVDATLQSSKTRAWGVMLPTFSKTDSYVPDLDDDLFRLLVRESTSVSQSLYKGGSDPKVEQFARRNRVGAMNQRYKSGNFQGAWNNYGRR